MTPAQRAYRAYKRAQQREREAFEAFRSVLASEVEVDGLSEVARRLKVTRQYVFWALGDRPSSRRHGTEAPRERP